MLIGIDASRATKEQKTGTEYYSEQIIYWLSKIDSKNQYILYSPVAPNGKLINLPKNFHWKIMPFPKLWSQIRLSWELVSGSPKPDVIFEPAHTIPFIHPKNIIVTLHDLGFKYFPELYTPLERKYHNFCMNFSARNAKKIITPSLYTKNDLVKTYHINPSKITVIHHGYNQEIYQPKKSHETIEAIKTSNPYIFFIGRLEKKKNLLGIFKTYELLRQERKIQHKLILAGKRGYGYEEFEEQKKKLPKNVQNDIIELGYTPEQELSLWMKNADIFFFPTFFEGFGLPIIEAMACNVPVVASNNTSIPEITGSAALLIDPNKPLEMAAALSKIINSASLKKSLQSKGLVRASIFSWEKAAKKTLDVLMNN